MRRLAVEIEEGLEDRALIAQLLPALNMEEADGP